MKTAIVDPSLFTIPYDAALVAALKQEGADVMFFGRAERLKPGDRLAKLNGYGVSAYQSADAYVGPAGITWLHRWALTRGMPGATFAGEPEVPQDIAARAAR